MDFSRLDSALNTECLPGQWKIQRDNDLTTTSSSSSKCVTMESLLNATIPEPKLKSNPASRFEIPVVPVITPDVEMELAAIRLRRFAYKDKFMKSSDSSANPKRFQIGTVVGGGMAAVGGGSESQAAGTWNRKRKSGIAFSVGKQYSSTLVTVKHRVDDGSSGVSSDDSSTGEEESDVTQIVDKKATWFKSRSTEDVKRSNKSEWSAEDTTSLKSMEDSDWFDKEPGSEKAKTKIVKIKKITKLTEEPVDAKQHHHHHHHSSSHRHHHSGKHHHSHRKHHAPSSKTYGSSYWSSSGRLLRNQMWGESTDSLRIFEQRSLQTSSLPSAVQCANTNCGVCNNCCQVGNMECVIPPAGNAAAVAAAPVTHHHYYYQGTVVPTLAPQRVAQTVVSRRTPVSVAPTWTSADFQARKANFQTIPGVTASQAQPIPSSASASTRIATNAAGLSSMPTAIPTMSPADILRRRQEIHSKVMAAREPARVAIPVTHKFPVNVVPNHDHSSHDHSH